MLISFCFVACFLLFWFESVQASGFMSLHVMFLLLVLLLLGIGMMAMAMAVVNLSEVSSPGAGCYYYFLDIVVRIFDTSIPVTIPYQTN